MFVNRNINIVASSLDCNPQAAELSRNDSKLVVGYILDCYLAACHGCETNETANFNHVGQDGVLCSAQRLNSLNCKQV